jgi:hypothetical protein
MSLNEMNDLIECFEFKAMAANPRNKTSTNLTKPAEFCQQSILQWLYILSP